MTGVAVDSSGNVYCSFGNQIYKITSPNVATIFAGKNYSGSDEGSTADALFFLPSGLAIDSTGKIYVADSNNHKIRLIQ